MKFHSYWEQIYSLLESTDFLYFIFWLWKIFPKFEEPHPDKNKNFHSSFPILLQDLQTKILQGSSENPEKPLSHSRPIFWKEKTQEKRKQNIGIHSGLDWALLAASVCLHHRDSWSEWYEGKKLMDMYSYSLLKSKVYQVFCRSGVLVQFHRLIIHLVLKFMSSRLNASKDDLESLFLMKSFLLF